ncbi:ATP-dependent DNA helicase RecG [Micrococcales bacterium 31B]|nr:ATP-dependent DNA helicase RecG [Micrococcales bacterium 31B]
MSALTFDTPLAKVPVPKAKVLADDLGLHTVRDLLTHFPRSYNRRGQLTDIASLLEKEHVTVVGRVASSQLRSNRGRGGQRLEIVLQDESGATLHLTFFHAAHYWESKLLVGTEAIFEGRVGRFRDNLQLAQPKVEFFDEHPDPAELERQRALPIPAYPACASVESNKLMLAVRSVLEQCELAAAADPAAFPDPLPRDVRDRHSLPGYLEALRLVHVPQGKPDIDRAHERLRFDEAFVLQAILAQRRHAIEEAIAQSFERRADSVLSQFDAHLPYRLTAGQVQVGDEIAADLERTHPMHRLLQGDVGAGKTVVALRAMLQVVAAGGQAALLAPTEVLATQHHASVLALLGDLADTVGLGSDGVRVSLLTGSLKTAARRSALNASATGEAGIVIGTHALLSERVQFFNLGLIVVDEQHRFGVEQRATLRERTDGTAQPHMLVMTATPIPRTLAMTQFGDLDVSVLTERPAQRAGVETRVVSDSATHMVQLWGWIGHQVSLGNQVFVVCSRIGDRENESDGEGTLDEAAPVPAGASGFARKLLGVVDVTDRLRALPALRDCRIELLHSRVPDAEKERVMRAYSTHECDILVATTMIEVGVNVPNATVMVIMDADRFGLSQLHQLRGRVGRGAKAGYAVLVAPASAINPNSTSGRRLAALAATEDGFALSRYDLEFRHEGDVLGSAQSGGLSSLKFLKVIDDEALIDVAREAATRLIASDPDLTREPGLAQAIDHRLRDRGIDYLEKG